jgi:HK97 family phage portal protein
VTTLQTVDGRLLRAQPAGVGSYTGYRSGSLAQFTSRPLWSDGTDDDGEFYLKSFEAIYRSQPIVAGVVDKLARRIATLPFDVYRRLENDGREVVAGDTLDSLLRHPMPRVGSAHLRHHIAQSLLIHGNALVAKVRGSDRLAAPVMLWPLNWAQISAYGDGRIEWWSTAQFGGEERYIAAVDTIHFAWPGPDGGEVGVSPLEKLGVTIRLEDAAQRNQVGIFKNGSRPSLAVSVEQEKADRTALEFARDRVEAMHKGVDNAGKTFFMGANVKVQTLSMSPIDTALIEQRKLNREEVGAVYDLAGPLMNDLEHGTFSNVQVLLDSLYRDVLPPWLMLIEQTFQAQLIDPQPEWFEKFVEHDLSDKLKGDPVELATSLKLQVEAGLLTRNEARRILNLPPIGDPKNPANPANQLTLNVNNQGPLAGMTSPPVGPASGVL